MGRVGRGCSRTTGARRVCDACVCIAAAPIAAPRSLYATATARVFGLDVMWALLEKSALRAPPAGVALEFLAGGGLLAANAPDENFRARVALRTDRRTESAANHRELADVRQRIGYRALEDDFRRVLLERGVGERGVECKEPVEEAIAGACPVVSGLRCPEGTRRAPCDRPIPRGRPDATRFRAAIGSPVRSDGARTRPARLATPSQRDTRASPRCDEADDGKVTADRSGRRSLACAGRMLSHPEDFGRGVNNSEHALAPRGESGRAIRRRYRVLRDKRGN